MSEYINIGKFVATFGFKGELILKHSLQKKTSMKGVEALFIENLSNSYLPYFIQQAKSKSNEEISLKLDGINTKEAAQKLLKKSVWLSEADFRKLVGKSSPIALLGFLVISNNKRLGVIDQVIEQPHQLLLSITYKGKQVFIPLHQQTLNKIDYKKQEVFVTLPEGLLDIYL